MFDPFLTLGFLVHFLVLIGALVWASEKLWKLPRKDFLPVGAVLLWASLVIGAHGASLLMSLNSLAVYIPATLLGVAAMISLGNIVARTGAAKPLLTAPKLAFADIRAPGLNKSLKIFLIVTFALAALASIALGLSVYPDNADSMIYRLPRAFWYVGHGSFLHPFLSLDKRTTFYPLDGVSLYVPLVLYNLPGTLHSLPSLTAWGLIGTVTYRFARELGARKLLAFFAAWLVALTPSILAQATSTNDEILAAVAVLLSLFMGFRWLVTGERLYFFVAATAIGLSAGTKGHIVFLMPMVFLGFALAAWAIKQKPQRFATWMRAIGPQTFLLSLGCLLAMVIPFFFYNYASSGRFYFFDDFKADVLNLRASFQGAFQNLLIYVSQMVFSPIADLNFWPNADKRQTFNTLLNGMIDPFIQPYIDPNPAFYHMSYRFVGITIPVSVRFVEFSLWSAFVWLLWPWQAALALKQKFPLNKLFALIALIPFLWLLIWSASTLYMEGTATYFTFYLICGAPASVFVFSKIASVLGNRLRWVTVGFVALTSLLICNNLLMYSGFRAIPDLFYAQKWPYDWDLADDQLIKEIREAKRIRIIMTHEKLPFFAYMHWNPSAVYETPYPVKSLKNPDEILQIFPVTTLYDYGYMPLKIKGKTTPGMTYIGSMRAIGKEVIFAVGAKVEERHPTESDYIIPHTMIMYDEGHKMYVMGMMPEVAGLKPDDHLEFSYELKRFTETIFVRDYKADPTFQTPLREDPRRMPYYLTIKVRSAWSHAPVSEATYRVAGPGGWLPDTQEY